MEESKVFGVSTTIPDASYIVGTDGFQKDLQQATQEYTDLDKVDYSVDDAATKEPMPRRQGARAQVVRARTPVPQSLFRRFIKASEFGL
jgi:hypothetical protein